jgi:hypothetical protein
MNIEEIALNDAWTVATESQQELAAIVDDLTELARVENKVVKWDQAIKRLGQAEKASMRAADTLAGLMAENDRLDVMNNEHRQ